MSSGGEGGGELFVWAYTKAGLNFQGLELSIEGTTAIKPSIIKININNLVENEADRTNF